MRVDLQQNEIGLYECLWESVLKATISFSPITLGRLVEKRVVKKQQVPAYDEPQPATTKDQIKEVRDNKVKQLPTPPPPLDANV